MHLFTGATVSENPPTVATSTSYDFIAPLEAIRPSLVRWRPSQVRVEAIATRVDDIATRVEAIPSRFEAIATRVEAIASRGGGHRY